MLSKFKKQDVNITKSIQRGNTFHRQVARKFEEEISKVLYLEHGFVQGVLISP